MIVRRRFLSQLGVGCVAAPFFPTCLEAKPHFALGPIQEKEDLFGYLQRTEGGWDRKAHLKILGHANAFKEGDQILGISAPDEASRQRARELLANTRLTDIDRQTIFSDDLASLLQKHTMPVPPNFPERMRDLKAFLLEKPESEIHRIKGALSSEVIGCVVKILSNAELVSIGSKVFNPLPNSSIGAKGYLGARIQPNSPTDHVEDIQWQVFNGFAYGVGDVLLGTNPVSSDPESVARVERALQKILLTFELQEAMPHCVLAHIDIQAEVEKNQPGSTELWFQSIAGNDAANKTFDLTVEKMLAHAQNRTQGRYGLYFETGQGADFTNGHGQGCDMVLLESRKYGFARALAQVVADSRLASGKTRDAWVHVNDVAGFIGPEVFRTKEQLVRCCLEDIVMGKLHGLTIGLDVCSTLHMDVSLDDLSWCLDQVAPANPAYLMALPTRIDPMLGYLTTGYQDHVYLRNRYQFRINEPMQRFFQQLGVIDREGKPAEHFGDPIWVYMQYQKRLGDTRPDTTLRKEGERAMAEVQSRGVFLTRGFGKQPWELDPKTEREIQRIYDDAKVSIWREWSPQFLSSLKNTLELRTQSTSREDYILHPSTGENLSQLSLDKLEALRRSSDSKDIDTVIVVSEGLNANACMEPSQLEPLVQGLRDGLIAQGKKVLSSLLVVHSGRVRAGYRIGETLFRGTTGKKTLLHIIGERPGSGHRTLSIYMTTADGDRWQSPNQVDHNITKVVSGIALTALTPERAVRDCLKLLT